MKSLKQIRKVKKVKDTLGISENYKTWIVSGASFLSAMLVKKAAEVLWKVTTHRDPPKNPADRDVSWGDALAWTLITGVFVNVVRLLIRRNVSIGIDE